MIGSSTRADDVQYGKSDSVSWKLSGRRIVGRLRVKARLRSGVGCDSRQLRFTARPGGR